MNGPCKNPNCHSCGQPHPNCRCYADGGEVLPAFDDTVDVPTQKAEAASSALPKFEDTIEAPGNELPKFEDTVDPTEDKYGSTSQMVKTGIEGAMQGVAGPIAPWLENKVLGVDYADIAGRAKANPWIHGTSEAGAMAGSLFTGYGEAGLIAKGSEAVASAAKLGKVGSAALNLFIQGASFAGSDEITKNLLHQPGTDPEPPVASALVHMLANGVITAGTGGLFNILGKGLNEVGGAKMTAMAEKLLANIAENKPVTRALEMAASYYAGSHSGRGFLGDIATGSGTYGTLRTILEPYLEKIAGKPLRKANEYVSDAMIAALLKENTLSIPTAMRWGSYVSKGVQSYLPAIEQLFKGASSQLVPPASKDLMEELGIWVEKGTPQEQMEKTIQENNSQSSSGYAKGGVVQERNNPPSEPDHFGTLYPEQNVLLNQAKGRIYGYLNSIRPLPNQSKLPFDENNPNTEKKRSYEKALAIAVNPLQILNHIQKGDLNIEHMKHFTQLFPEIHRLLSRKMTDKIMEAQLAGDKPPYAKRQAMSLFLGAALDSTFTPQSIQAAQATFAQKKAAMQPQPQGKTKGNKSALNKTSQNYATDDQSAQRRQQSLKV